MKFSFKIVIITIVVLLVIIAVVLGNFIKKAEPLYIPSSTYNNEEYIAIIALANKGKYNIQLIDLNLENGEMLKGEFGYSETNLLTSADLIHEDKHAKFTPLSKEDNIVPSTKYTSEIFYGIRLKSSNPIKKIEIKYKYLFFEKILIYENSMLDL